MFRYAHRDVVAGAQILSCPQTLSMSNEPLLIYPDSAYSRAGM